MEARVEKKEEVVCVPEWRDGAQARSVDVMRLLTC